MDSMKKFKNKDLNAEIRKLKNQIAKDKDFDPGMLRSIADNIDREMVTNKVGYLKHDLYHVNRKNNLNSTFDLEYRALTKDTILGILDGLKDCLEIAIPKGAKFLGKQDLSSYEGYLWNPEDDKNLLFMSDLDKKWADANLENIEEVK